MSARSKVAREPRPVLDRGVPGGDLEEPEPRVPARGLELQEELVRLDAPLVVRLVVVLLGELADDLDAAEALAPDLREERVEVLRREILLVLGEDLDDVLQRLALDLVELPLLCGAHALAAGAAVVGRLEDADEPLLGLFVVAESPVAPRALEERQAVERRVDLALEREDLLVLGERGLVVEVRVEDGLGLGHVRVGREAAVGVVLEDLLEAVARLVLLALLEGEEAVDVEREVVLVEPGVVLEHAREQVAGDAVIELGRGAARADGEACPTRRSARRTSRARSPTGAPTAGRAPQRASRGPRAGSRPRT